MLNNIEDRDKTRIYLKMTKTHVYLNKLDDTSEYFC